MGKSKLTISRAPSPSELIWENLGLKFSWRRFLLTWGITVVVLVVSGLVNLSLAGVGEGVRVVDLEFRPQSLGSPLASGREQTYKAFAVLGVEGREALHADSVLKRQNGAVLDCHLHQHRPHSLLQ